MNRYFYRCADCLGVCTTAEQIRGIYLAGVSRLGKCGAGVCMNCGLSPCACAIPKWTAQRKNLPIGMRRFKKRPRGIAPK